MTVEQLNVIVTAQTSDFQQKIAEVNRSLSRTIQLAEAAAGKIADISILQPDENAFSKSYAERTAIDSDNDTADGKAVSAYENMVGARANVIGLRRNETLIGAADSDTGGNGFSKPIEIHTTVELDGEKVGESVNMYNSSRMKVLNGWGI